MSMPPSTAMTYGLPLPTLPFDQVSREATLVAWPGVQPTSPGVLALMLEPQ